MVTFSAVDCAYVGKTSNEVLDIVTGRITASVTLNCLWSARLALADDILLNRRTYPLVTTSFSPVANTCRIVQFDEDFNQLTDGQWRPPRLAQVTVEYGESKTLLTESLEPSGDFIRQDYSMFRWGSKNGTPLIPEESPGRYMPKMKMVRRLYKLSGLPANVLTAMGKCNQAAYTSGLLGVTFAPETLVYGEPSIERTITLAGSDGWNYTQQWAYEPNGWNHYWRAETGTWEQIYQVTASGVALPWKSYVPTDFSGLLA